MLSFQQMTYILALHEEGQFQRASEKCFVTQPTLSMQIKKAEEQLSQQIFNRLASPIELTEFGKELLPILQDTLNDYDRINALKKSYIGSRKERIRIGIIPTVGIYLIPKMISSISSKLPNCQIEFEELKSSELISSLENYKLDLIVMAGPFFDVKFKSIKLFEEEILIYCPNSQKEEFNLEDIQDLQPWLLSHGNCLRNQMIEFCQIVNKDQNSILNYKGGNIEIVMSMVEQYGGYTLIPEFIPLPANQQKCLKKLVSGGLYPGREIIAAYPSRSYKAEYVKEIISILKTYFLSVKEKNLEIIAWK